MVIGCPLNLTSQADNTVNLIPGLQNTNANYDPIVTITLRFGIKQVNKGDITTVIKCRL